MIPPEPRLTLRWSARQPPLEPVAAMARGGAAIEMLASLLARGEEALREVSGVSGSDTVVVMAARAELLPWADGVIYLGREPLAPTLLLPTTLRPTLPVQLLERAIVSRMPAGSTPVVVSPVDSALVAMGSARPLRREMLQQVLCRMAEQREGRR